MPCQQGHLKVSLRNPYFKLYRVIVIICTYINICKHAAYKCETAEAKPRSTVYQNKITQCFVTAQLPRASAPQSTTTQSTNGLNKGKVRTNHGSNPNLQNCKGLLLSVSVASAKFQRSLIYSLVITW